MIQLFGEDFFSKASVVSVLLTVRVCVHGMAWDGFLFFGSFFSLSVLLSGSFLPFFFGQNTTAGLAERVLSRSKEQQIAAAAASSAAFPAAFSL